jgi:hypothetical protein
MPSPGWNPSFGDRRCGPELSGPPGPSPAAASTAAASLRGVAREPRVPGGAAPGRGEQLRRKAAAERVGRRVWAGGGEPEQRLADLDLPGPPAVLAAADPPTRSWRGRPATAAGLATDDITGGGAAQPYSNRVVEVRHEHRHRH